MAIFSERFNGPADEMFARGVPADRGTLGPNAPAKINSDAHKDPWAARLYDSPLAKDFANQSFSSDGAKQFQAKLQSFTGQPNLGNKGDDLLAKDFLNKYVATGLVPEDQKVSDATIDFLRKQQPGEGIGNPEVVASLKMKNIPGEKGTSV